MVQQGRELLLEQRPASGLWGGLYGFPEFADPQLAEGWLATLNDGDWTLEALGPFRHTFSHYHLDIQPLLARPARALPPRSMEGERQLWYNLDHPATVGLSAATLKLLAYPELQTERIP